MSSKKRYTIIDFLSLKGRIRKKAFFIGIKNIEKGL